MRQEMIDVVGQLHPTITASGNAMDVPLWVKGDLCSVYGSFIDYLVRRLIEDRVRVPHTDSRACFVSESDCTTLGITSDELDVLDNAFTRYEDKSLRTEDIVPDVFHTSLCHSVAFGRRDVVKLIGTSDLLAADALQALCLYADAVTSGSTACVETNPNLDDVVQGLLADADLIIDDRLIDMKAYRSRRIGEETADFYQLICYAVMWTAKTGMPIRTLEIYNPLMNYRAIADISTWTRTDALLNYLRSLL